MIRLWDTISFDINNENEFSSVVTAAVISAGDQFGDEFYVNVVDIIPDGKGSYIVLMEISEHD